MNMKRWNVRRGPHGVDISVVVFTWFFRFLVVGAILAAASWTTSIGKLDRLGIPFVTFKPIPTAHMVKHEWCGGGHVGSWPPQAYCNSPDGPLYQRDWENWLNEKTARPRLSLYAHTQPHPWLIAVILLAIAWFAYRKTRPVDLQVRPNGIRIDGRFVNRDQLRSCEIHRGIWLPSIVIHMDGGRWKSPPLRMEGWRVAELVVEVQGILPSAKQAEEAVAAKVWMDEDARALLASAAQDQGRRRRTTTSASSHIQPTAEPPV